MYSTSDSDERSLAFGSPDLSTYSSNIVDSSLIGGFVYPSYLGITLLVLATAGTVYALIEARRLAGVAVALLVLVWFSMGADLNPLIRVYPFSALDAARFHLFMVPFMALLGAALTALAVDANGVVIPNMDFRWEVLKPLAGSISGENRLTVASNIGAFSDAVKATLVQTEEASGGPISANLDVTVLDLGNAADRIAASVLPGVISLRPGEQIRFSTLFLDSTGNQITPVEPVWEILDSRAGTIDQRGRFTAAESPEIYVDVVRVTAGLPDTNETLVATATVAIVDVSPPAVIAPDSFRVQIFPERVVLSPGESTRVSIISLDGDVRFLSTANVDWSLNPPEVGAVSQFVNVTAHGLPRCLRGRYPC